MMRQAISSLLGELHARRVGPEKDRFKLAVHLAETLMRDGLLRQPPETTQPKGRWRPSEEELAGALRVHCPLCCMPAGMRCFSEKTGNHTGPHVGRIRLANES